jgi:hypothetical protein
MGLTKIPFSASCRTLFSGTNRPVWPPVTLSSEIALAVEAPNPSAIATISKGISARRAAPLLIGIKYLLGAHERAGTARAPFSPYVDDSITRNQKRVTYDSLSFSGFSAVEAERPRSLQGLSRESVASLR